MKPKFLLIIVLASICIPSFSQSIYSIQYNFHQPQDSNDYHAILIRYPDGGGLLRVRYINTSTQQDILIESDIDEQNAIDDSGMEDSTTLNLKTINPRIIRGDNDLKFDPVTIVFKYNSSNDFFEPADISNNEKNIGSPSQHSFQWQLMEGAALNKEFVSQFFSEDEDFYTNLFKPVTKGLSPLEKNIRLNLLIVADTMDASIGSSCAKDLQRAIETFRALTDYLGIKFLPKTVCGKDYSKVNVQSAINALRPSANDIVVFYYTGHGFRLPEKPRDFPNLKLKNFKNLRASFRDSISWIKKDRQDNITYSLNMEDIFNSIRKKEARFNLVLSDCCNNDIFSVNAKGTKPGKTKGSGVEWNEDNIRALFLNKNPMSILASAASSGQKATSNDDFGGFFSYFFKLSMENYCSKLKTNPTWDLIFQDAKTQTINKANHTYCDKPYIPANICQQTPVYKIVFGK